MTDAPHDVAGDQAADQPAQRQAGEDGSGPGRREAFAVEADRDVGEHQAVADGDQPDRHQHAGDGDKRHGAVRPSCAPILEDVLVHADGKVIRTPQSRSVKSDIARWTAE